MSSLLRNCPRGAPRHLQRLGYVSPSETLNQKILRWLDVTGMLTRWIQTTYSVSLLCLLTGGIHVGSSSSIWTLIFVRILVCGQNGREKVKSFISPCCVTQSYRSALLFLFYCCTLATPYSAYLDLQEVWYGCSRQYYHCSLSWSIKGRSLLGPCP